MKIIVIREEDNLEVEMHDDGSVISITDIDLDYDLAMEEFGEGPATRARVFLAMQRDPLHFLMQELLLTSKSGIPNFMFDCIEHAIGSFVRYSDTGFSFKNEPSIERLMGYLKRSRAVHFEFSEALVLFNEIRNWMQSLTVHHLGWARDSSEEWRNREQFIETYSAKQRSVFLDITRVLMHALGYHDGLMGYRISPVTGGIQEELLKLCYVELLAAGSTEERAAKDWYLQTNERAWQIRRFFKCVAKTAKGRKRLLP